eukprot:7380968-Prymnesium_polylepis.4
MRRALLLAPRTHATASPPPGPNASPPSTRLILGVLFACCAASLSPPLHPSVLPRPIPGPCAPAPRRLRYGRFT